MSGHCIQRSTGQSMRCLGSDEMLNNFFDRFIFTNNLKYVHNNFYLINLPFLIIPNELLVGLVRRENTELNKDIYYTIRSATRRSLVRQFNLDFRLEGERALNLVEQFFTAAGWGGIKRTDLDAEKHRAIVSVSNSPIAQTLKGKVTRPVDHFLRGILAGLFSDFFKTDVECFEKECIATNQKECLFIIKPLHDFDFSKKETRRQLRVES